MSKQSTLVGTVVDSVPQHYSTVHAEKFYSITVDFNGTVIPVLISEYILKEKYEGTIQVTGCVISEYKRGNLPKFVFYANDIVSVDVDTPMSNEVNFCGKVTKDRGFTTNSRCRDLLPLTISDISPTHSTSVLYICARDKIARELKNKEIGYSVEGKGYLKQYRDVYEILVTELNVL